MAATSTVSSKGDIAKALAEATNQLTRSDVLVGIPGVDARPLEPGEKTAVSNAVLGYVHELGDEQLHIPARPFLLPGIAAVQSEIVAEFAAAGVVGLSGGSIADVKNYLSRAGLIAQASVKKVILTGEFAPLSRRTLQARAERLNSSGKLSQAQTSKAARKELKSRAAGNAPTIDARPLYDTHSLFNAITYVVDQKGS